MILKSVIFPTRRERDSFFILVCVLPSVYVHMCGWRVKIHINYLKAKQELIFFLKKGLV